MRLFVVAALVAGSACARPEPSPPPAVATAAATATAAPTAPSAPGAFGALDEEQFKALHEPPKGEPVALKGAMIDLAGTRAYLSLPPGAQPPMQGVTVIHEWWGLNDNVKLWADRLAAEGFAALAVDLYGGVVATDADAAMKAMQAVEQPEATRVLLAAHAFLKDDPRVQARTRASIGWCFGGAQSLQLAIAAPDLDACVLYYGRVVTDVERLRKIRARVLGIFGTQDQSIPPDDVAAFDRALTEAGVRHVIRSWDAPHAFANPSNPRYDRKAAAEAWEVARAFLKEGAGP